MRMIRRLVCELDIIDRCMLNCVGCWTHSYIKNDKNAQLHILEHDLLKELLPQLKSLGVGTINFSGRGEPFLHKNIFDILELSHNLEFDIGMTTSAHVLPQRISEFVRLNSLKTFKISIWSFLKETLADLCPNRSFVEFEESLNMVKQIASLRKARVIFNCIINGSNYQEMDVFIEKASELGVDFLKFEPILPFDKNRDLLLNKENVEYLLSNSSLHMSKCKKLGLRTNLGIFL